MERKLAEFELLRLDLSRICSRLALQMNSIPVAFEIASGILSRNPYDLETILLLCNLYLKTLDYENVLELLEDPVAKGWPAAITEDGRIWTRLSLAYYHLRNYHKSLFTVNKAIGLSDNGDPNLYILQCRVLLKTPALEYSLESIMPFFEKTLKLTQALQMPALHVEALLSRAQLFKKYGDLEGTRVDLVDAMSILNNEHALKFFDARDFLLKTAFTYTLAATVQDSDEKSLELIECAFEKFNHTQQSIQPLLLMKSIICCMMRKDLHDILQELVISLDYLPKESQCMTCYLIARVLLEIDPVSNAAYAYQYLQRCLFLDEKNPLALVSLGFLYFNRKQINDSLSTFSSAVKLFEKMEYDTQVDTATLRALSWLGIAKDYFTAGDIEKATKASDEYSRYTAEHLISPSVSNMRVSLMAKSYDKYLDVPFKFIFNQNVMEEASAFKVNERVENESITAFVNDSNLLDSTSPSFSNMNLNHTPRCNYKESVKKSAKLSRKKSDIFRKMPLSISKSSNQKPKKTVSSQISSSPALSATLAHNSNLSVVPNFSSYYEPVMNEPVYIDRNPSNFYFPSVVSASTNASNPYLSPVSQISQSSNFPTSAPFTAMRHYPQDPYKNMHNSMAENSIPISDCNTNYGHTMTARPMFTDSLHILDRPRFVRNGVPMSVPNHSQFTAAGLAPSNMRSYYHT